MSLGLQGQAAGMFAEDMAEAIVATIAVVIVGAMMFAIAAGVGGWILIPLMVAISHSDPESILEDFRKKRLKKRIAEVTDSILKIFNDQKVRESLTNGLEKCPLIIKESFANYYRSNLDEIAKGLRRDIDEKRELQRESSEKLAALATKAAYVRENEIKPLIAKVDRFVTSFEEL